MANMDARTPTAQPTPITMVNTKPNRSGMLARLIHNSAQYCFTGDYLSAKASTTRSLAARSAGGAALTKATRQAAAIATSMINSGIESPGIHFAV
jgi:hypothetical protein